jgi:hypothetical protein
MFNIIKYTRTKSARHASENTNRFVERVAVDNGIIQDVTFVYETYKLFYELGLPIGEPQGFRRVYDALAGVKLNNQGGNDYVQVMYDMNNVSPVNAVQGAATSQPLWDTDADLPSGVRTPRFDGVNDFLTVNDLGIFNAQSAGTLSAIAKDTNRTGGNTNHNVITITTGGGSSRAVLNTRDLGNNTFNAVGRRLDSDSVALSTRNPSMDGFNQLTGLFVWGENILQLITNTTAQTSAPYSSGGGITSATNSTVFNIGAVNQFPGIITSVAASRVALSTAQNTALYNFRKQFYRSLP